ncbi:diacylglyceryl transferase [Ilyomonas limi]|uniref:Diacylglyceryl transferase n=1 Tax=Ilyomonas limi TaxID=2575867 RepID=A0A4U3L0W3_9BACT|nr:prolipoprotein diacylglyceryl transferase family protein [Ilyomonas limi]TKK68598.1 diacylglyceryl transferase [Ilyomonas limi]
MHFPVQIPVGSNAIYLHTITESLGMFAGFRYFLYLRKKEGDKIESPNRIWIIIGAIFGAVIGSRFIGGLENVHDLLNAGNTWLYFYTNKTIVGGLLGGLFGVELMKKIIGEPTSSGDLFTYPLILAIIIGRIGCFSMGVYEETYGLPTHVFWAMNLGDGLLRHPVSLYEIVFLLLLWLALIKINNTYPLQNGALFKLFMMAYLLFRLMLDFIKPHYTLIFGLSTIQLTCIAGLIYYYRYMLHPKKLMAYPLIKIYA